jgi:ATP-dependent Clp protease, protease subunit
MRMPRPCFRFNAATDSAPESLQILDEIGFWGVQAKDFKASLDGIKGDTLDVEVNSPGGDVFAGLAIFNMLRNSGKTINMRVMGVAASAASLIAMAGDTIEMPSNTFMMVHNPWSVAMGNADDMREAADVLDKIGGSLLSTYCKRTGQSEDDMKAMLAKDTWLTADECLEKGFATKVTDPVSASASFDMERADLPAAVKAVFAMAQKTPEQIKAEADTAAAAEVERLAKEKADKDAADAVAAAAAAAAIKAAANPEVAKTIQDAAIAAGLPEHADHFAVACDTVEIANARIAAAKEITVLCGIAKRPDDAKALIRGGKSVAEARAALLNAMASADVHVDTTKPVPTPNPASAGMKNPKDVYASRNQPKKAK